MRFRFAINRNAVLFLTVLALSAAATIANRKIRYDARTPQFAIFGSIGTRVICVFYSMSKLELEARESRLMVVTWLLDPFMSSSAEGYSFGVL